MIQTIDVKTFKKRIIKLRKSSEYSQVELAKILDVTQRTISFYELENNENLPSAHILVKLAEVFNVSLEELLCLDEIKPDARTIEAKTLNKLKKVAMLPKEDRDLIIRMVDNLLKKNKES